MENERDSLFLHAASAGGSILPERNISFGARKSGIPILACSLHQFDDVHGGCAKALYLYYKWTTKMLLQPRNRRQRRQGTTHQQRFYLPIVFSYSSFFQLLFLLVRIGVSQDLKNSTNSQPHEVTNPDTSVTLFTRLLSDNQRTPK